MPVKQADDTSVSLNHADRKVLLQQHHFSHASQAPDVIRRVSESLDAGQVEVIELDLGEMQIMTSNTLNELITLNTRAKSCGVRLVLTNLADNLRDIFAITRLERMFELAQSNS